MIDAVPNGFTRGQRPQPSPQILGPDGLPYRKDYGDFALPNVLGFSAILGSAYKTYYHQAFDEAYRHDRQDPLVMRQDAFLMGLLQERKLAVASESWHLEIPDEKDKHQVMVRDCLTKALEGVWGLRRFFWESLDAIWYGRMGQSCEWKWENIDGQRVLSLKKFSPINGDKIGHKYDGTPYVLINSAVGSNIPGAEYVYSTVQKGILIKGTWAEHVLIHHHHRVDADFFDADRAEAIHGLGIRSDLFWINWIRLEWQARISDFVDRVGLGLTIWYFEQGNNASYLAVKKAAEEQSGKLNILLPCPPGKKPGEGTGVQRIETPATGADLLNRIIEPLRKDIERYVVGQEASSKGDGSKGLGNEASAEFQQDTKFNITQFDAWLLADFLTGSAHRPGVVSVMKRWSFPWADFPVNFVFGAEKPQAEKKLDGAKTLFDMRVPLKADEVRAAGGFSKPGPGDETVKAPDEQPGDNPNAPKPGGNPNAPKPGGTVDNVLKGARVRRAGDNWRPQTGPRGGLWDYNTQTGAKRHRVEANQREGEPSHYATENDQGGLIPEDKTAARRVDLITLPEGVQGTNCGNCRYFNDEKGFCENEQVHQPVNERMCCALWDSEGVERNYDRDGQPVHYGSLPGHLANAPDRERRAAFANMEEKEGSAPKSPATPSAPTAPPSPSTPAISATPKPPPPPKPTPTAAAPQSGEQPTPTSTPQTSQQVKAPWHMNSQQFAKSGIKIFQTSQGSTYAYANGQTLRIKTPHAGHGTKDVGLKHGSEVTYFTDPESARKIGMWNSLQGASGKRLIVQGDEILMTSINPRTGQRGLDGRVKIHSKEPKDGLSPVELWDASSQGQGWFRANHPGNAITATKNPDREAHKAFVAAALQAGKKVPPEVLREYPDLVSVQQQMQRDDSPAQYANPNQPRDRDGTWTNPKTKKRRRLKRRLEKMLEEAERLKDELRELAKLKEEYTRGREPAQYGGSEPGHLANASDAERKAAFAHMKGKEGSTPKSPSTPSVPAVPTSPPVPETPAPPKSPAPPPESTPQAAPATTQPPIAQPVSASTHALDLGALDRQIQAALDSEDRPALEKIAHDLGIAVSPDMDTFDLGMSAFDTVSAKQREEQQRKDESQSLGQFTEEEKARGPNTALPDATRPALSTQDQNALRNFSSYFFHDINKAVRQGQEPRDTAARETLHGLRNAFDKAPSFAQPVKVYRGVGLTGRGSEGGQALLAQIQAAAANQGTLRMKGYTSTTTSEKYLTKTDANFVLEIEADKGLDMKPYAVHPWEQELLLDNDSEYQVQGIEEASGVIRAKLKQIPARAAGQVQQRQRETPPAQYFDPNEPRDPAGKWTSGGGSVGKGEPNDKTQFYPPPTEAVPDATRETRGQVQSTPLPPRPKTAKSPSSAAERSPLHRSLETVRMRHAANLSSGANEAYLLDLDDGTQGVFKPVKGESDISPQGMTPGTGYLREVAASRIAEILGFHDLVPTTTFREQAGEGVGSMQQFVADAPEAARLSKDARYDGLEDAARAAVFDYLLGNVDRHQGNWLVKDGKLALIDNGFSLPHRYSKDDLYNMEFWRHAVKNDLEIPDVAAWKDKWPELEKELKACGIEDDAVTLTRQRFDNLVKARSAFFADLPGFFSGWTMRQIVDTYDKRSRAKADGVHLESI